MPGSFVQDVRTSRSAWMRVSDQLVRGARNVHESTKSKFNTTRESSLGGIKKKPRPKGRGSLFDAWQ